MHANKRILKKAGFTTAGARAEKRLPACAVFAAVLGASLLLAVPTPTPAATATLQPRSVPIPLHDMVLSVPVGGDLTYPPQGDPAPVEARLNADLASAQQQATKILASLLNRSDRCGDQLDVRNGRFGAQTPALRVIGTVDYSRSACIAGRTVPVVPRALYDVDMLLNPVVAARSLRVRAEVLSLRAQGAGLPAQVEAPMREMLGRLVSERIGDLFPKEALNANIPLALNSVAFEEAKSGQLSARIDGSATLPRSMLQALLRQR